MNPVFDSVRSVIETMEDIYGMKHVRLLAVMLAFAICLAPAASLSAEAEGRKLNIVTTIFPVYDWILQAAAEADHAEVSMLLDSGVDLHSYRPTAADMMTIATCDVFVYVGGESDKWVEDALKGSVNPDQVVISLLDILGSDVKAEELIEGMEPESHEDGDGEEADEHVWLSLRNAQKLVTAIAVRLGEADPDCAEAYSAGAAAYCERLAALDARYSEVISAAGHKTILFGDRFPFRYLADDYGLTCYAAFSGCSAETEAGFRTIVFLAQKMDELNLPAVLTIEGSSHRIAETVIQATAGKNQKILALDSMQSVTAAELQAGASYLGIMEENLEILREALE